MNDGETDLAILIANLKGKKKKEWFRTAQACRRMLSRYNNSYQKVAKEVGVSGEIIREVESINDLPQEAQQILLSDGKGLDKAYRISTKIKGAKKQVKVAKAVADLGAHDARKVIDYILQNPEISIEKCKKRVLKSKTVTEKVYAIVLPLDEKHFKKLKEKSKKLKIAPGELANKIVEEWLERRNV